MSDKILSVIVDDEPGNIVTLKELLKEYCPQVKIEDHFSNPVKALEAIPVIQPTLVFLDIEMPQLNAFALLDKLSPVNFEVIFVTAFHEHAIKAIKYAALDYILKPVNIDELKAAVERAEKKIGEKNVNTRVSSLLTNLKTKNGYKKKLALPTADGYYFEDVASIMHLRSEGGYTGVMIKGQKKETFFLKSLKDFEEVLPESDFCRIHHNHIININYVKKYFKGRGGFVEMEDGTRYEISARKKDDFLEMFMR